MSKFSSYLRSLAVATALASACGSPQPARSLAGYFPAEPVGAGDVSQDEAAALARAFASAPRVDGGPCLVEPTVGARFPRNAPPPLFEWSPLLGEDVFELRVHVEGQPNDLLAYTNKSSYVLPAASWTALAAGSSDTDVVVSVRGATRSGSGVSGPVATGTSGAVRVAPVEALGTVVYWTTSNGTALKGFSVGDDRVRTALTPSQVTAAGRPTGCVGCHASSPDGRAVFFGRVDAGSSAYSVDARLLDGSATSLPTVTANARANLARSQQDLPVLSPGFWSVDAAAVVTNLRDASTGFKWELVSTDLLATAGGSFILRRVGDMNQAANASWSRDARTLVYSSCTAVVDGHPDVGSCDLWSVPYGGGAALPLPGVSDATVSSYYPSHSPRDALVAFNRNVRGTQMYNSPSAEVWVVPAAGGKPTRVTANDANTCAGAPSPGQTNSWPRWSPSSTEASGRRWYWLVFSSRRRAGLAGDHPPQLFMSAVTTVLSAGSEVVEATYPAFYVTTQPANESNHTPAWDDFVIPVG